MKKEKSLGYDDIGIICRHKSTIEHRGDGSIDTSIKFGKTVLDLPIIGSPMPDCSSGEFSRQLKENGCFSFIHRFNSIDKQLKEFKTSSNWFNGINLSTGCAIGVTDNYFDRFKTLYDNGCRYFLIDVANGFSILVERTIKEIKKYAQDIFIVAGNINSLEGYKFLYDLDVDAVRIGIGGGSACTTRIETGVYRGGASCILEIMEWIINYSVQTQKRPLIIADGGIKEPRHMAVAIAIGADAIMMGGILAQTSDSPAKTLRLDDKLYKVFRGAASYSTQLDYGKDPKYVEGLESLRPIGSSLDKTIKRFKGGLLSSLSYMNAKNLDEFRKNVDWCIL